MPMASAGHLSFTRQHIYHIKTYQTAVISLEICYTTIPRSPALSSSTSWSFIVPLLLSKICSTLFPFLPSYQMLFIIQSPWAGEWQDVRGCPQSQLSASCDFFSKSALLIMGSVKAIYDRIAMPVIVGFIYAKREVTCASREESQCLACHCIKLEDRTIHKSAITSLYGVLEPVHLPGIRGYLNNRYRCLTIHFTWDNDQHLLIVGYVTGQGVIWQDCWFGDLVSFHHEACVSILRMGAAVPCLAILPLQFSMRKLAQLQPLANHTPLCVAQDQLACSS